MVREKVKNANFTHRQIGGGQVQIGLYAQETALANMLLHFFRALLRPRIIQRRNAGAGGALAHIFVARVQMLAPGVGEDQRRDLFSRKHQPVGFQKVFNTVVLGHQRRPGNRALHFARF